MANVPKKTRRIAAAFIIVSVIWAIDITTGGAPAPAQGLERAPGSGAPIVIEADPPDAAQLKRFLARIDAAPPPFEVPTDLRDPFSRAATTVESPVATESAPHALRDDSSNVAANSPQAPARDASAEFQSAHRLRGVLLGRVSSALIDDGVYQRGSRIGDYRIVAIGRDAVVLNGPSGRIVVRVPPPALNEPQR